MSSLSLDQFIEQCRSAELALAQPCAPAAKEQALARLENMMTQLEAAPFGEQDKAKAIEALMALRVKGSSAARVDRVRGNMAKMLERAKQRGQDSPSRRLDVIS